MDTPESLALHQGDYQPDAWRKWTILELLLWEYLYTTRATRHRVAGPKRDKDQADAANYRAMRQEKQKAGEGATRGDLATELGELLGNVGVILDREGKR